MKWDSIKKKATSLIDDASVSTKSAVENTAKVISSAGTEVLESSKKISDSNVARASSELIDRAKRAVGTVGDNHEKIADHVDTAAKATKVAAGVAVAGAAISAPTGLTALGVSLGVVSAPAVVTAAPILIGAAGVAFTASAGASLYSKYRSRTEDGEASESSEEPSEEDNSKASD